MKIENTFRVDLPVAEAWATLLDIPAIVPCMPGAELLAIEDERTYRGQVRVKLGPVAVAFQGRAHLQNVNVAARTACVKAAGTETKGRGSAQADVNFRLQPDGAGTRVHIVTDIALAGAVAQYGRAQGVIADVAQVLIDTFAENLRRQIARGSAQPGAAAAVPMEREAAGAPAALSVSSLLVGLIKRWLARLRARSVPR